MAKKATMKYRTIWNTQASATFYTHLPVTAEWNLMLKSKIMSTPTYRVWQDINRDKKSPQIRPLVIAKNIPSLYKFCKYIRCTTCIHYDIVFSWHGTMHNFLRFKFNSQTNRAFNPISKLIKRSVCFRCLGGGLLISWSSYCFPFVV